MHFSKLVCILCDFHVSLRARLECLDQYKNTIPSFLQIDTFQSWANLFHKDQLIKLGPVVLSTLTLYLTMHYVHSPLALPGVLIVIPLVFHAVLLAIGCSLAEAADHGWVQQPQAILFTLRNPVPLPNPLPCFRSGC